MEIRLRQFSGFDYREHTFIVFDLESLNVCGRVGQAYMAD